MKRKILDVTVLCMFCICLIVTANIEERSAGRTGERQTRTNESAMTDENAAPVAGVCRTLSGYSFTTESDEKTGISKKQTTLVTASENKDSDEEVAGQDREDEKEAEENPAVLAGLAKPVNAAETMSTTAAQNRWDITLTQDEIDLLAKIVWLESRGEPVEGQEAVVEVIFNRMTSGKFPTTVYEVLSQGNPVQFCSWKNRDYAEPTEKEYQSIQNVLDGKTSILRNDTLYFSTEPLTPRIDRQIGGHSFCY
ncbi:MAG: cell wall hydrolase [Roseburia sp.]|nr:cell wall hydrolase [Roseburia sp.]